MTLVLGHSLWVIFVCDFCSGLMSALVNASVWLVRAFYFIFSVGLTFVCYSVDCMGVSIMFLDCLSLDFIECMQRSDN